MSEKLILMLDTNVVIDCLLEREPFCKEARLLMVLGYANECELWINSSQVTDLIYVLSGGGKKSLMKDALSQIRGLRQFLNVYPVGEGLVDKMLLTNWRDAEDFLIYLCALEIKADAIITRNKDDFEEQLINIFDCSDLFDWIKETKSIDYSLIEW